MNANVSISCFIIIDMSTIDKSNIKANININNSLHLAQKKLHGSYMFTEADSFCRTSLTGNCPL